MNIPQATVSRDPAAMCEFWREFPVSDFEKVRLERLQKIDAMTFIALLCIFFQRARARDTLPRSLLLPASPILASQRPMPLREIARARKCSQN